MAGGSGTRLGSEIPKQFLPLKGYPMLWWSLRAFNLQDPNTKIILVLPEDFIDMWAEIDSNLVDQKIPHSVIKGGTSRTESVRNGLSLISELDSLVAIHDAARPLVSIDLITRGYETAKKLGNGIPCVDLTDSIREISEVGSKAVDRSKFKAVQTPQVFNTRVLKESYDGFKDTSFSDDAAVVENAGLKIHIFEGDKKNMKVTNPGDLEIASLLLEREL